MAGGILLQSAASTGNGNTWNFRGISGEYTLSVEPTGTVSGGEVQFESAPYDSYGGTWSAVGSAMTPSTSTLVTQQVTGRYRAMRARITSDITGGGSVTCRVDGPDYGD